MTSAELGSGAASTIVTSALAAASSRAGEGTFLNLNFAVAATPLLRSIMILGCARTGSVELDRMMIANKKTLALISFQGVIKRVSRSDHPRFIGDSNRQNTNAIILRECESPR